MNYIRRNSMGIEVDGITTNTSLVKYLNEICICNFSTLEGRINASSIILKKRNKVPFYVSSNLALYPSESMRNFQCVLINYHNVLSINKHGNNSSKVTFNNLDTIKIALSVSKVRMQHEATRKLLGF